MLSCNPCAVVFSWLTLTPSVSPTPAAILLIVLSFPALPIDTVLSLSASELVPSATEFSPVAVEP
ncbi:hypothetical protein CSR63_13715 [Salmonella enterica subsp. enterica serovar Weltevreden]|nr:hypothetical protein [Salmonella enterica subsp. enterica serovar Weltevreden]EDM5326375.1 hypothetical protein [Salmonella enterica subsp. enterica serovar Weltevreden]